MTKGDDFGVNTENVYMPSRALAVTRDELIKRSKEPGISFPCMPHMKPMIGGDLVSVLGRPGHGKTTFALSIVKDADRTFSNKLTGDRRYVMYATWETTIAEFTALFTASSTGHTIHELSGSGIDIDKYMKSAVGFVNSRVMAFGRSSKRKADGGQILGPVPTLDELETQIMILRDNSIEIGLVVVDYVQRIPLKGEKVWDKRTAATTENIERCKDMALGLNVPFLVLCQAGRTVDDLSGLQLPRMQDAQWTSSIEQTSDKVLSITKPDGYLDLGQTLALRDDMYSVRRDTFIAKCLKQRWANSGDYSVLSMNPVDFSIRQQLPEVAAY